MQAGVPQHLKHLPKYLIPKNLSELQKLAPTATTSVKKSNPFDNAIKKRKNTRDPLKTFKHEKSAHKDTTESGSSFGIKSHVPGMPAPKKQKVKSSEKDFEKIFDSSEKEQKGKKSARGARGGRGGRGGRGKSRGRGKH